MYEHVYENFYRVERTGVDTLSDGGGPFGFDISSAVQIDYLIRAHQCDAILETGCHRGDTSAYLSATYPDLPVLTCDIDPTSAKFTRRRLRSHQNLTVFQMDSRQFLAEQLPSYKKPFVYLDAHWNHVDWPLDAELSLIGSGVICIDDFDIGHPRFAFDHYEGVVCGPDLLTKHRDRIPEFYVANPKATYPFPCLQIGRRAGKAFIEMNLQKRAMAGSEWFIHRENA